MTKALSVSERQARTLLRAADKEGGVIEVKVGDTVFRLIPASLAQDRRAIEPPEEIEL